MLKKILGYGLLTIVVLAGSGFAFLYFRKPTSAPASDIRVAMTPDRIARGKYIFELADCDGCHSQHDTTKQYWPVVESGRGRATSWGRKALSSWISRTSLRTGIRHWKVDGWRKIRAIREGVHRDGTALFPMMPYEEYRNMSDDDVQSLVAYLNSLPPVRHNSPCPTVGFPVNLLIKGVPEPVTKPVATPDPTNKRLYGEYLTSVGVCVVCHTQENKGSLIREKLFAGGRRLMSWGTRWYRRISLRTKRLASAIGI